MNLPSFLMPLADIPAASSEPDGSLPAVAGSALVNPLPFLMQSQLQTEWCWAATAASVSSFYRDVPMLSQCQIATDCLSVPCCITPLPPPPPPDWEGNRSYTLDVALTAIGHLAGQPMGRPLEFPEIMTEINGGRPVCCHIKWDDGGPIGHFNAIIGYDQIHQDVIIRDPYSKYGAGTYPWDVFRNNYYGGAWDDSYLTQ